jgi:hypothetical protein
MNTARTSQNGTLLSDGRVLISGGYDGAHYIDSAEI